MLDYRALDVEIIKAGFSPSDLTLSYHDAAICLDGSRTITVLDSNGEFVAVAFVPVFDNRDEVEAD